MNKMNLNISFLSAEGQKKIEEICERFGVKEFDAYIDFYTSVTGKPVIQIDGELTLKELRCLFVIAEFIYL